jgi:hypothetical protein
VGPRGEIYLRRQVTAVAFVLGASAALLLAWPSLSHLWFALIAASVGGVAPTGLASHDTWRQAGQAGPAPARPRPPIAARDRKRGKLLPPGATVTLGGEPAATEVDEVPASLDRELVGLLR